MANATAPPKRQNRINLQNISERDRDILSLDTSVAMKKYKIQKQAVYDRRFALNKKIKSAGLTLEEVLNQTENTEQPASNTEPKKTRAKKSQPVEEHGSKYNELMVMNQEVPVIMKPMEISFDGFSIRLNGVPKKISVNPDTQAIEIDL
jgi:hypothetical protein